MLLEVCIGIVAVLFYVYYKLSKNKNHWNERGVPNTGFRFFWGNDEGFLKGTKSVHDAVKEEYFQFPGERFYGGWTMLGQPYLMIRNDFELIKAVWIKDFDHFDKTRGADLVKNIWPSSRAERLAINHVANVHGEVWKDLRSTFTPVFTSGKLKKMLPLLQEINEKIENYIREQSRSNENIELKDLMGKFSMDALASCAFGVDSGSFTANNEDPEFVKQAKIIFDFANTSAILQNLFAMFTPASIKKFFFTLGFTNFATLPNLKPQAFFHKIIEASIKQRKESKIRRNDLVDLMIDATEGRLDGSEENDHLHDKKENAHNEKKAKEVDYDQVISTAGILLVAGYDTTGTTMSYILYELALNQDCQDTLFEEIENAKKSGCLSYDTIQSLPYLDAVVHETMRRHPAISALERPCTKDYKLPNTDLVIKTGELVRMSNMGIFFDPDIFPNPEEWNPDNFSKENTASRSPYSFVAFSLGPRNCLAMRFAFFEMKVAISHMVSKFKILPTAKTTSNVEIDPKHVLGGAKGGLWIKFEER